MDRISLKGFLESYTNNIPIYPSRFPISIETGYMFEFTGNTNMDGTLSNAQLTIFARSKDISEAEILILNMKEQLHNQSNIDIGNTNVVKITTIGKHAEYAGIDDNERYYFTARFTFMVDELEK